MIKQKSLCYAFGSGSYDGYIMKQCRIAETGFTPVPHKKRTKSIH